MSPERSDEPPAVTAPIATGWRARVRPRRGFERARDSAPAIVQIVVAASAAYAFAHLVLGHPSPLLAATVTISSLGLVRDARPRRVLETVIGMLVGVLVSELIVVVVGSGTWQLALALAATLLTARALSAQPSFAISAAIQSVIVIAIPGSMPFLRLVDGSVGAVAALLATALLPRRPLREVSRAGRALSANFDGAAATVIQALRRGDRVRADRGLEKARALQPLVDDWATSLDSGLAVARISPFLRRQREELQRQDRMRASLDLATRNLRVIARRVVYALEDRQPRPIAADLLAQIARAADLLGQSIDDIALEPAARESLLAVATRLDPTSLAPGSSLGDQNVITALRPLVVDLLTAAGMPQAEARAAMPRI
ncbi:FUSC family protein [Microbacterium sp. NE2HP2]|uniref:FUSC family protein n=1 Tax=Microbacterium TaxID=33882 RepID=UPI00236502F8|nr:MULTISPECIES: FUSC family protein [Microbacterium]MDD7944801.1 FUSC family protein [Microbacterium plantarum]WHE35205.1 FUSC family protein [Microbacterium sp. BDGP8]WRK16309.1 FUSC family protein [Microbacterium plantarum]